MKNLYTPSRAMFLALSCMLVLLAGCKSTSTPQGVHPLAIPVGGGVDFEFEAPADGIVFIVDSKNNQLISSRSVRVGEVYRFGDDSLEMVRLIGLREHGPSFTLRTDYGEKEKFPEVPSMKTPLLAVYFATLEQMDFKSDQLQPRADPGSKSNSEPSVEELGSVLVQ
ncbi:MAG: hypothetical protein AB8C95_13945 [Phycisphaeraceae bacterium]